MAPSDHRWTSRRAFVLAGALMEAAGISRRLVDIAETLGRLKQGELLSPESTDYLLTLMGQTVTGSSRLRAGLAPGWTLRHKTGTGQDLPPRSTGYNDVGIMTAPDGTSYALAIFIRSTHEGIRERQALMQAVAQRLRDSVRA